MSKLPRILLSLCLVLIFNVGAEAQNAPAKAFNSLTKIRTDASNRAQKSKHKFKFNDAASSKLLGGQAVSFSFPEGEVQFQSSNKKDEGQGKTLLAGKLKKGRGEGSLLFQDNKFISGSIRQDDKNLIRTILPDGKGGFTVDTYDASKFPGCEEKASDTLPEADTIASAASAPVTASADGTVTIDVMVVWSPEARAAAGSVDAIRATAVQAVAESNQAYANSGVFQRLNLVYTGELTQSESSDFGTNLSWLRGQSDGVWDEVHSIRNTVAADEVVVLVNNNGLCGQAYLMTGLSTSFESSAFAAVNRGCAVGYYSFAHELGHNMGSHHDHTNASGALYSYSYGYNFVGTNGGKYRTIMAYNNDANNPEARIQHFSNPEVLYAGTPTGVASGAGAANNALSLNNTAATVAAFRQNPTVCSVGSPTLTLSPSSQNGSAGATFNFTLTVKNNDSTACLPSTFNVASAFPAGWAGSVSSSTVQVTAGSTASVGVSLASASSSTPAGYSFSLSVADGSAVHSKSTNGTVNILAPTIPDTTAPTAPAQLTATVKKGQNMLKWLAASDNVGVTGYQIFRNGVQIATSTGASYSDRSVTSRTSYQYSVKAKDAAGNISNSSNTVTVTAR